jgi:hypothetical protein
MPVTLKQIALPDFGALGPRPVVPASTYAARADAALGRAGVDWLAVYGDREHFGNIMFLSGFEPRFEEAFLVLGQGGRRVLITGNECESYASLAVLPGLTVLLSQTLSLMGQDRTRFPRFSNRLADAGIKPGDSVGLVGWKYLEPEESEDREGSFFVPDAYVSALARAVGRDGNLVEATPVLMHPETGLRATIDADQIAEFEWAATRCSDAVWRVVAGVREGDSEYEAIGRMGYAGDPLNVHTMFASAAPGAPLVGLRSPTGRRLKRGDGVTTAVGLWGALSSRAGLLDRDDASFLKTAKAYFEGIVAWYATAEIGVAGADLHAAVAEALAHGGLRSTLNPGHLTGHEEWVHSPVRPGSAERLRSGMPFQVDIIPTPLPAGQALNCEDPVTFADADLRAELRTRHPECHARIEARRAFMRDELGVDLRLSILPLSSTPLYLPPFWLRPDHVLARD